MYPADPLLKRFHNHSVPITLASDAHIPAHTARDRGRAIDLARSVGYTERIQFRRRIGEMVPLD
jgi:histidinol phosphatase-like PHP family hydrolase